MNLFIFSYNIDDNKKTIFFPSYDWDHV
jgi:hypothetical protein